MSEGRGGFIEGWQTQSDGVDYAAKKTKTAPRFFRLPRGEGRDGAKHMKQKYGRGGYMYFYKPIIPAGFRDAMHLSA